VPEVPARLLDEDTADRLGGGEEVAARIPRMGW
jgi:hypothetical protein